MGSPCMQSWNHWLREFWSDSCLTSWQVPGATCPSFQRRPLALGSLSLCAKVASDVCYCEGAIFSAVTTERASGSQTTQGVCDNALHTVRRSILTTVHAGADLLGRAEGLVQPIV